MSSKIAVTYAWTCQGCDATGTTFASCEKHSTSKSHVVWFKGIPTVKETS